MPTDQLMLSKIIIMFLRKFPVKSPTSVLAAYPVTNSRQSNDSLCRAFHYPKVIQHCPDDQPAYTNLYMRNHIRDGKDHGKCVHNKHDVFTYSLGKPSGTWTTISSQSSITSFTLLPQLSHSHPASYHVRERTFCYPEIITVHGVHLLCRSLLQQVHWLRNKKTADCTCTSHRQPPRKYQKVWIPHWRLLPTIN